MVTNHAEGTFANLRYSLGGDHPSQTTHHTLSPLAQIRTKMQKGWYFNGASTITSVTASFAPTYPTHLIFKHNVKL
jgi:hypothetical protein